jgi:hypothetical protein
MRHRANRVGHITNLSVTDVSASWDNGMAGLLVQHGAKRQVSQPERRTIALVDPRRVGVLVSPCHPGQTG